MNIPQVNQASVSLGEKSNQPRHCEASTRAKTSKQAHIAAANLSGFASGSFSMSAGVHDGQPAASVKAAHRSTPIPSVPIPVAPQPSTKSTSAPVPVVPQPSSRSTSAPVIVAPQISTRSTAKEKGEPIIRSSPRSRGKSVVTGRRTISLSGESLGAPRSKSLQSAVGGSSMRSNKRKKMEGIGLYTNLETGRQVFNVSSDF
ncbi:MAG: hypothetical protein Q8807_02630 ['Waltheria sp.' little leaf phytoplasma]|nr:hypothetical protein ['Waltheria sp.' little leaf phytoplasma]